MTLEKKLRNIVLSSAAAATLAACATNGNYDPVQTARNNSAIMYEGQVGEAAKDNLNLTPAQRLDLAVDYIQEVASCEPKPYVKGFCLGPQYHAMTSQEAKDQYTINFMQNFSPGELAGFTIKYKETLTAAEMARWENEAMWKDLVSGAVWSAIIGYAAGYAGGSAAAPAQTTPTIGTTGTGGEQTITGSVITSGFGTTTPAAPVTQILPGGGWRP